MDSTVEQSVAAKLLWAHENGSPVAPSSDTLTAEMAAIARRRWNSFERRNANIADTTENRNMSAEFFEFLSTRPFVSWDA